MFISASSMTESDLVEIYSLRPGALGAQQERNHSEFSCIAHDCVDCGWTGFKNSSREWWKDERCEYMTGGDDHKHSVKNVPLYGMSRLKESDYLA